MSRSDRVRWMRGAAAALAAVAGALLPLTARASEPAARLVWSAPPGCPSAAQVFASVAALVRPGPLHWERFDVVRGRIVRSGSDWQLELAFVRGAELRQRDLQARECRDLADAAAVAIVLALNTAEPDTRASPLAEGAAAPAAPLGADAVDDSAPELPHAAPFALQLGAEGVLDPFASGATYRFPSGSTQIRIALAANELDESGEVVLHPSSIIFGSGPAPAPGTDPDGGYLLASSYSPGVSIADSHIAPPTKGFAYTLSSEYSARDVDNAARMSPDELLLIEQHVVDEGRLLDGRAD